MTNGRIGRRDLLRMSAAMGGSALLVACLPEQLPTGASPSATAEAQGSAGRFKVGKLEGPEIITDSARFPRAFKEAPELASLVQQGRLPPVAERVGQDPIVIKPVHSIGRYGGTLRKAVTGGVDGDLTAHKFMTGPASLLFVDYEWKKVVPNIARSFELSSDAKVLTLQLRRGMKWSDGQPFTADDILFWFEDIYNNEQIHPGDSPDLLVGGQKVIIEKVGQYAVRYVSPVPNALLLQILASPITDLGGAFRHSLGRGGYAPKHYLQKFHAKYAGEAEANKLATDAKYANWVAHIKAKMEYKANPEIPVVYPWVVKVPLTNPNQFVLERNPYSVWVDTEGNQLPYIGTVQHTVAESTEVVALRATAGEIDFQESLFDLGKLPILVDNQDRGGYAVHLDPAQGVIGVALNLAYEEDPEIGQLLRNVDFRRALSLGVDRAQINEALFLGTGVPSSPAPSDDNKFFPGKEWRTKWATFDATGARQLLDKIGYAQHDPDGYRLRKDGKGRISLRFQSVDRVANFAGMAEMIKQTWKQIGIDLLIEPTASNLAQQQIQANIAQMTGNTVSSDHVFINTGTFTPGGGGFTAIMGVPYGQWWQSKGARGKEPPAIIKQALELLDRGRQAASEEEQIRLGQELVRLAVDNVFGIGIVGMDPSIRISKKNLGNVPARTLNSGTLLSPGGTSMAQTYYFKSS